MTVTINNTEYKVKYNLRAMFIFEQITKKPFNVSTMFDEYVLMYSCLLAGTKNADLEFEDFIDFCEDNPTLLGEFSEYLHNEAQKQLKYQEDSKKVESL